MNSLVYIIYNKRLQHKFLKKNALKDDEDPLVNEDVPSDDEWMVEEDVVGGTSIDGHESTEWEPTSRRKKKEKYK